MKHTYLIALDGSGPSMAATRYAAAMLPADRSEIVLFLVESDIPDSLWDIYSEPERLGSEDALMEWNRRQKQCFATILEAARQTFVDAGFARKHISIKMQKRKEGIARDILSESTDGYAAVFAGRKGVTNLPRLPIGNISRRLVARIQQIPLVLVSESLETRHILIGFDNSRDSRRCLRLAASLFADSDRYIHIRHIARTQLPFPCPSHEVAAGILREAQSKDRYGKMESALQKAAQILQDNHFRKDSIDCLIAEGYMNRSLGLLDIAEKNAWGTIMVGRRGLSRMQDFLVGRVGEKLVELSRDQTIWIVPENSTVWP
ncbi:universal stress protein [Desulfobotulus sp. H1]|uniref:Universal stress protein n=1 Tax=Desulfobotulus pelophilus TaxID=2823377 RepID=A0ABT3N9Y1_9BACT|nr:universal stress protein [Desulfobotulus pelophilus]MCW7754270.1 universal stress protein [Desulfobotulus pelophilus]